MNNVDGQETESMKLLKNILPESIIQRMQQGQKFVADSHGHVVILFSGESGNDVAIHWCLPCPRLRPEASKWVTGRMLPFVTSTLLPWCAPWV